MVMMDSHNDYYGLDIRVFYLCIACGDRKTVAEAPATLALRYFLPTTDYSVSASSSSSSPSGLLVLRRDRADCDALEVTYVSTHHLHIALPTFRFAVYSGTNVFLCGVVHRLASPALACTAKQQQKQPQTLSPPQQRNAASASAAAWTIQCTAAPRRLLRNAKTQAGKAFLEVSIAGKASSSGLPVVLSEALFLRSTVQPSQHSTSTTATLATIAEDECEGDNCAEITAAATRDNTAMTATVPQLFHSLKDSVNEEASDYPCWHESEYKYKYDYSSDEEREGTAAMSWFKSGVRVGVGLGMGMCIGLGVGVGILLHSYMSSSSPSSILQHRPSRRIH